MNKNKKPVAVLYSDPNFLALEILEELVSDNFLVYVVTDEKNTWRQKTLGAKNTQSFLITDTKKYREIPSFDYAIFCGGFIKKSFALQDFKKFINNTNFGDAKTLALFPWEIAREPNLKQTSVNKSSSLLYVGDLLGDKLDLNSNLLLPSLINDMIRKRVLTMAVGELFFPLEAVVVAKYVVKSLSDGGLFGKQIYLLGTRVTSLMFLKSNSLYFKDLKIIYDTKLNARELPKNKQIRTVSSDFNYALRATYKAILKRVVLRSTKTETKNLSAAPPLKKNKIPLKFKPWSFSAPKLKRIRSLTLSIFGILIFPVLTTLIATLCLFFSYKQFLRDNISNSQRLSLFSKAIFVIGKGESTFLSKLPAVGTVYREIAYASYLGENVSDTFAYTAPSFDSAKVLFDNVLGTGVYDLKEPSSKIKTSLDYALAKIINIQETTIKNSDLHVNLAKQILNLVDFDKLITVFKQSSLLADNLPKILGSDINKRYLVLFQNNMELRPTGGFIGSYGLVDFSGGKLNALTVNDVYSADGQLKGHVEPPAPIKKYLGEANWWLRDSNWNPEFPISAQRAEWFLNKEMDQNVNGTFAIDLNPVREILKYTGPIFLPDYNLTITSENLYEKTQEESQANFFPGSRKKASFLTALSRVMINEISKLNSKQKLAVLKSIFNGLEARNIQIYLHDKDLQNSVEQMSWGGSIPSYVCGQGCYSDFLADVEANVGVNKSNYFVNRGLNFEAAIINNRIVRNLEITLNNSANPSLGASGQYKTYMRILIPQDANVISAQLLNGQTQTDLNTDITQAGNFQEVGSYLEILPGQTRNVVLRWESKLPDDTGISSYGLYVRKQAGTGSDPLNIKLDSDLPVLNTQPRFSLTGKGVYTYNTNLSKDFFARASFKQ